MRNIAHCLGLARDDSPRRLLRACGIDEARITGGASDYDRYLAFAEALPFCAGHPLRERAERTLRELLDVNAALCPHTAHALWDQWNDRFWFLREQKNDILPSDCPYCKPCTPAAIIAAEDCISLPEPLGASSFTLPVWTKELESALRDGGDHPVCMLPEDYTFVRPDPYHASEFLRKSEGGEALSDSERNLIMTQALRVWGCASVREGQEKTLILRGGRAAAVVDLLAYLATSKALPRMVWVPDHLADAGEISGMYACVGTGFAVSDTENSAEYAEKMTAYAAIAPLGMATVWVEKENNACGT